MMPLRLGGPADAAPVFLFLGAHSDDIEIGCGATLLALLAARPDTVVHWAVFSARDARADEAQRSAEAFLEAIPAAQRHIRLHTFRDGFFPTESGAIKEVFESLKGEVQPQLIFTHCRGDRHQDHRTLNELTWNTWRNHLVLEYEIPKYDGDLGQPNAFCPVSPELAERKIALLEEHFGSQRSKQWFDAETFRGLMRIRGLEANAPERYAEAFYARKCRLVF